MSDIPYQFDEQDAYRFASEFSNGKFYKKGDELVFSSCPYCHGGSHKDRSTFSINLKTGLNTCHRGSCAVKGNMVSLARDFGFQLNDEISRYHNIANYNGKFKTFRDSHKQIVSKDAAVEYLRSRGISEGVTKRYEITSRNDDDNILAFPFKNEDGDLKLIKYRNTKFVKGESFGSKEWTESGCMPILFGMPQCNRANKTLIITEGQIDSLSVSEAGFENAVSVPFGKEGFTWIGHCWDFVTSFERMIVFGDMEDGTMSLLEKLNSRFGERMAIWHVRSVDYRNCKDANEILMKHGATQIKACIDNAIQMPIKHIISLSDVAPVNIYETEKLKTGLNELDQLLYGGLPFGGITLVSGKPGEGKSTLASQILINAIAQGYTCFAYSGELPNSVFKNWMDFQIAGNNYLGKYNDAFTKEERYMLKPNIQDMIDAWYRDKCFIYDNNVIQNDEDEEQSLCAIIETVIAQYGARVILIDNLMTALDLEQVPGSDKYEKQSQFMKRITRIALSKNVLIILVAHKRKNNLSANENDEISGSGDIANLAMVTLSYQKDKELAPEDRLLKVNKNRWFGKTNDKGWPLQFDSFSKRIYSEKHDNRDVDYGFMKSVDGFIEADETAVPF